MTYCMIKINNKIAWCYSVIQNAARQAKRRELRYHRELLTLNSTTDEGQEHIELLPHHGAKEELDGVEFVNYINSLPKELSLILYATFVENRTQQEIATCMNLPQQQISRLKRKALETIKSEIKNEL